MEWNSIVQIGLGVVIAVIGYFYREIKNKGDSTQLDLLNYKLHVSETYVSNDQLTKAVESLSKNIDSVAAGVLRIENRILGQIDRRGV